MHPIFLYWPTISEADIGGMAVEAESSHQYSVTCCCCVTDGSRGAVWHNGICYRSAYEGKVWNWISTCGKNGTYWHSWMLAEHLWRPGSGCEHTEAVGGVFQQQWQQQWSPLLVRIFTSVACKLLFIAGKNPELAVVAVLRHSASYLRICSGK